MRVTRLGWKAVVFYAMLIFAFFAAPYLNLFFMLLAFCTVLGGLNVWWSFRNIRGISGHLEDAVPMPAEAGQIAHATLSCKHRTRSDLRLGLRVCGREHGILDGAELRPGNPTRVDVMLPPLPRGVHDVQRLRVTSIFPFGSVEAFCNLTAPETIVVYPAPADLARYRDRNDAGGNGLGGDSPTEMGPAGLRDFRDGDELRNVHWKASARRRELVVKEFEGDAAPGMEVVLDLRAHGPELEEALSLISALALESKENKELFTLQTQEHRGTYGKGHTSFGKLLAYLAGVQPLPDSCPPPPTASPTVLRLPLCRRTTAPSDPIAATTGGKG